MSTHDYWFFLDRENTTIIPTTDSWIKIQELKYRTKMSGIDSNYHSTVCISWINCPDILFLTIMSGVFLHDKITLSLIASNSDCTQFHPMPWHRPIDSTQSCAILAQRLLQVACIILYSMLRLITSHNDIASIMDAMLVSTSQALLAIDHA
jgi:hypothetical protein